MLVFLMACDVKSEKGNSKPGMVYSIPLEEDGAVVHAYAPKVFTDYEDQILVITRDGKALVQYDKYTGSILKESLISDLPQGEILSDLISRRSPMSDLNEVLNDPMVTETMMFYAFIKNDNKVMAALSMKIPVDSVVKHQGEVVTARVFKFGLAILSLDKDLEYKDHKRLNIAGLKADTVNPASSDWLKMDDYLALPLQFGDGASLGYRYAIMRETKSSYKLSWLGALPDVSGLKAHDGFNKFAWSFSDDFVSIGNHIYEIENLTNTGLQLKRKYVVDSTDDIGSFVVKNDAIYYEVGHPVDIFNSVETKFEVRIFQLNEGVSKTLICREKRVEHSPSLFTQHGVYFANKPLNKPCELVFHPF